LAGAIRGPDLNSDPDGEYGALVRGARMLAGMISPVAGSPGAAGIAGIRSLLPGSGSAEQEFARYNEAAGDQGSVLDRVALPGEDRMAALSRQATSPAMMAEAMNVASMAAPLVVHASPVKWAGQPTRAAAGSGEGGAAYGEGLYGSIPANAKGIEARYGGHPGRPESAAVYVKDPETGHVVSTLRADTLAEAQAMLPKVKKQLGDKYSYVATGMAPLEPTGSFHVWDVPDRMMDWDKPLNQQDAAATKILTDDLNAKRRAFGIEESPDVLAQHSLTGRQQYQALNEQRPASDALQRSGLAGHRYLGEAGSSGEARGIPNYVIYDDAAVKPLGTFASADEFLASDLYKQLQPRILQEQADLVQRYPHLKDYFGMGDAMAGAIP
jgi:hypothetical protein